MEKKIIAITSGDPQGVGPEIIEKSLKEYLPKNPLVIFGERKYFLSSKYIEIDRIDKSLSNEIYFFDLNPGNRESSFYYVETVAKYALRGSVSAIVTGPVSKQNWKQGGVSFKGHTGYLAHFCKVKQYVMFFWSENLKVPLYTTHIPLNSLFKHLDKEKIIKFIKFTHSELLKTFNKNFKFLIPGINPHAGENGLMGHEEVDIIIPAIKELKKEMDIEGPFAPDTAFLKALSTNDSVVFSFYHDQGLIPFKLLNFDKGVNMTLGLPFIRTSPDHGPAFDIAGKGMANPNSMKTAITLADSLV